MGYDAGNTGPPTLSSETTVIEDDQFLRDDGSVNYVRAVNDWRSEGITSENNARVDLMRAIGGARFIPAEWPVSWAMVAGDQTPLPTGPFFSDITLNTQPLEDWYDPAL